MCRPTPSRRQESSAPVTSVSPGRQRGDGLGVPAAGVVVGERDDVQTGGGGVAHQLGRGVRAVGSGGVGVQIDAHDAYSRL